MNTFVERYDPIKDLDELLGEKINIYNMSTRGRKSLTVVTGLDLNMEDEKIFLSRGKERFSTAGYKKMVPEFDQKDESYCFNGDKRLECKQLIMELFHKHHDVFYIH